MKKSTVITALLLSFVILSGCANKVQISGTVTFEDGEQVTRGHVTFRADDGSTYYGYIDKSGKYSPGETRDGQPIPIGVYQVWLTATDYSDANDVVHATVDGKYTSPDTTQLSFEVKRGGPNTFNFSVERYK